ncbi:hypothetical protein IMZ48_49200, partial [Candidatus Bathyarchaeota archaeon]|nr:hypothetical protein [Candidatus Bathyarchaeota archaeon]
MRPSTHKIVPWTVMSRPACTLFSQSPTTICHRPLLTASTSPRTKTRRAFHPTPTTYLPRRRDFFTSNACLQKKGESETPQSGAQVKRKPRAGVKKSLRRVAIIAQQPSQRGSATGEATAPSNMISAVCAAEGFSMGTVQELLAAQGYQVDPDGTG